MSWNNIKLEISLKITNSQQSAFARIFKVTFITLVSSFTMGSKDAQPSEKVKRKHCQTDKMRRHTNFQCTQQLSITKEQYLCKNDGSENSCHYCHPHMVLETKELKMHDTHKNPFSYNLKYHRTVNCIKM